MFMHMIINLTLLRWSMLKNYLFNQMIHSPILVSLMVIFPVILYVVVELFLPADIKTYAINQNLKELCNGYNVLFHQILYFTTILAAPGYLFLSQINHRSYQNYKHTKISYKKVTLANILMLLMMLDIIMMMVLTILLFHTSSTLLASIIVVVMVIGSCNSVVYLLFLCNQMLSNLIMNVIHISSSTLLDFLSTAFLTLIVLLPVKYISFYSVMKIPSTMIVIVLVIVTLLTTFMYKKAYIQVQYIARSKNKNEYVLMPSGNITVIKNYMLMLFGARKVYAEYAVTLLIILILMNVSNNIVISNDGFLLLFIPIFLVSNGIIYSNKKWFILRSNRIFNQMLMIDTCFSMITLVFFCFIFNIVQFGNYTIRAVIIYCLLALIQRQLKLEYGDDSKTPVVFVLTYGILTFITFYLLNWVL